METLEPFNIIYQTAEDGLGDTVKPRLMEAEADLERVLVIDDIIADAAARYFRENGISKLPSYKSLQAEIESLIKEKNSGYNDYRAKREEYRRLQTVKGNIDQILRRERKPVKRQEQER